MYNSWVAVHFEKCKPKEFYKKGERWGHFTLMKPRHLFQNGTPNFTKENWRYISLYLNYFSILKVIKKSIC